MFFLVASCNSQKFPNVTISFGAINTPFNPYMSATLPGFHTCQNDKFNIQYSLTERKILIPFNESDNKGVFHYTHCKMLIDNQLSQTTKKVLKPMSFLTFYFNNIMTPVPFFSQNKDQNMIFTNFDIELPSNFKSSNNFSVIPSNLKEVKVGDIIIITFSAHFHEMSETEQQTNIFSEILIFISAIFLLISFFVVSYYRKYFSKGDSVAPSEVWTRSKINSEIALLASTGGVIVFTLIIITKLIENSELSNSLLYPSLFISMVVISIFRLFFAIPYGENFESADVFSSLLLIYSVIIAPQRFLQASYLILGSFRGPNVYSTILGDTIFLLFSLLFAHGLCRSYRRVIKAEPVKQSAIPKESIRNISPNTYLTHLMSFIASVIMLPAINDIISSSYNNVFPNYYLISTSVLMYITAVSIPAIKRMANCVILGCPFWVPANMAEGKWTTIFCLFISVFSVYINGAYKSFSAILNIGCIVVSILCSVFCIGLFGSLLFSFLFAATTFQYPSYKV